MIIIKLTQDDVERLKLGRELVVKDDEKYFYCLRIEKKPTMR
jgi:hypothetical protein